MFPISSLKTWLNCYTRLLNPFSCIYAGLTPKIVYIRMCAKGQILFDFSLMWIRLTHLLAFHMPWDRSDSTFHYPIEELYKEPFGYIEGMRNWEQENYSPLLPELVLESASPLSLGALLCSSQSFLCFVRFLLRYGGLKWWRPRWRTPFLQFTEVSTEFDTTLSLFY